MQPILITIMAVAILAITLYLKFNQAKIKGKRGERKVASIIHSLPNDYYSFNDVYLDSNGTSVQIDHIVISQFGIFVIETKNYTGMIFGTDQSEQWIKNMYGNKYYFQNPLKQNYLHVKALQNLFGLTIDKFIPIVVFLKGAKLKCYTHGIVIYPTQLKRVIGSYTEQIIDTDEVENLVYLLQSANINNRETQKAHITNVRQKLNQTRNSINNGICPKCGGKLTKRYGRYGRFIGCSNYPQCNFTIQK